MDRENNRRNSILVVEENTKILFAFNTFLEKEGYVCIEASNVKEAFRQIRHEKPTAIFMDISAPFPDGIKILKKLKKMDPALPVIMITSDHAHEGVQEALQLGAVGFLEKPLSISAIRNVLNNLNA